MGQRLLAGAHSISFVPSNWEKRFHNDSLTFSLRSKNLQRLLSRVDRQFDFLVQVFGVVTPPGRPHVIYADHTYQMAEHWPIWLPSKASDRQRWLERERRMYSGARHVFTMGRQAADSLQASYGVPPERVTVVGGGVNFEQLPEPVLLPREPLILFVGREYLRKGGDVLVEAFRKVREWNPRVRLRIVGTSEPVQEPGVEVWGLIPDRRRLEEAYREATVVCLPSRHEPYGLALLEAMAYGLPCVGTTVGGIPEIIVDGETGHLVPPEDPRALAIALTRVLEHSDEADALGRAGRRRIERELNWDAVAGRMGAALAG